MHEVLVRARPALRPARKYKARKDWSVTVWTSEIIENTNEFFTVRRKKQVGRVVRRRSL